MEPLASPIHVPIVASPVVTSLVCGGHLAIALILLSVFPLTIYSAGAVFGVGVSLVVQYSGWVDLGGRVYAVLLRSNDRWSILTCQGEVVTARLAGTVFVSPWLVILQLKPRGQRTAHIVLTRENTDRDTFRRLCVRLRLPLK
jgi:Membrane-bound toxin component of toxin-antitoxin system